MAGRIFLVSVSVFLLAVLCNLVYGDIREDYSHVWTWMEADANYRALGKPNIFFDKSVYFPDVKVFWDQNASLVPIRIVVTDKFVGSNFVKVKIFSSVERKQVTSTKTGSGRFEGLVVANCLRTWESVSNETTFEVRYGDTILARYAGQSHATAFIAYPKYVLERAFVSLESWKLFDSEGVPLVNYGWPIGVQYNPVTVSQYAFAIYYMYVTTENSTFRNTFLVQANWLAKNVVQKANFSVWEYHFDWPDYKLTNPFVSAMAQGEGLSVLLRAYALSGNLTYLEVAETAMRSFEVEMNSAGVRYTDSSGVWYEEAADVGAPSSKVLNGFIFALFGLYEYSFQANSGKGYALFWEGASTLTKSLSL